MGRPRKNKDDHWMPKRVYRGKSAYEFRTEDGDCIRLADLDAARSVVVAAWERALVAEPTDTVGAMLDEYFDSDKYRKLSRSTRTDYEKSSRAVRGTFGKMKSKSWKAPQIRKFLDIRAAAKSIYIANHELRFMKAVCKWGFQRGWVDVNPTTGVEQFTEPKRERYVTDEEYKAVYDVAPPMIQAAMEIAYLTGARQKDIRELTRFQLRDQGIFIRQSKTRHQQIKAWTERLRAAIALADSVDPDYAGSLIIRNANGTKYTEQGFGLAFRRAKAAAERATGTKPDWRFHDLKKKFVTDFEGTIEEKQHAAGHATRRMTEHYDQSVPVVRTIGSKKE